MVAAIRGKLRILGQEIGEFGFFSQRNADHKKGFAPRSEKSRLFLWGFTRGVPQHCGESLPRTRAKLPERVREKKSKHHGLGVTGSSLPLYAGKVCETVGKKRAPPSLWMLGNCCGDRRVEGFPTLAGFVVKGGDALHSAAFTCLLSCFPPAFPPRCLAQNTRKTTPFRDRRLFPALPPADTAQRAFPGEAARLWLPPGGQLRR